MGFGGYYFLKDEFSAPGRLSESKIIIVPQGYSVKSIASLLSDHGIIDNSLVFRGEFACLVSQNLCCPENMKYFLQWLTET